jgi:hypothetical protein
MFFNSTCNRFSYNCRSTFSREDATTKIRPRPNNTNHYIKAVAQAIPLSEIFRPRNPPLKFFWLCLIVLREFILNAF